MRDEEIEKIKICEQNWSFKTEAFLKKFLEKLKLKNDNNEKYTLFVWGSKFIRAIFSLYAKCINILVWNVRTITYFL